MSDGPLTWTTLDDGSRLAMFKLGDKFGSFRIRPHDSPNAEEQWMAEAYIQFGMIASAAEAKDTKLEQTMQQWLDQLGGKPLE